MLILIGRIERVTHSKNTVDKDTGETVSAPPQLSIIHTTNDDPESEQELVKIKLKDPAQAEAFRKCLGQFVRVPVRTWQSGERSGFWLERGVLPTVLQQAPKAAA